MQGLLRGVRERAAGPAGAPASPFCPSSSTTVVVQNMQDSLIMPCLGRPFQPGMLYDARNHTIGPQLWTEDKLQSTIVTQDYPEQKHELVAEESVVDKMSHLDVGASLSMSLLGGLIDISGSARYVQDNKTSKHHARVALRYKSTTVAEDFPLVELQKLRDSFPSVFESRDNGAPTHVAFRVVYGSQVFMVFDIMATEEQNQMNIQGKLQAELKLGVPLLEAASAEIDADVKTDNKSFFERISIKFYGDGVKLAYNPTNYEEALDVYKNLPGMTGEKGAPQMVWLYPLNNLVPSIPIVVPELSSACTGKAHQLVDNIQDLQVRCNDILTKTNSNFKNIHIHKQLSRFQKWIAGKRGEMTTKLSETLPAVHGDKRKESQLHEFLDEFEKLFPYDSLSSWMSEKEAELIMFLSYVNVLLKAGVKPAFQDDETGLASLYANASVDRLLFLRFNINQQDAYLESLLKGEKPSLQSEPVWYEMWYKDTKTLIETKYEVSDFANIASAFKGKKQVLFAMTCGSVKKPSGKLAAMEDYGVGEFSFQTLPYHCALWSTILKIKIEGYLSVKDGNISPGTPIVCNTKDDKQQTWKKLYIMMGTFYLVSMLDDKLRLKLAIENGKAVVSYNGTLLEEQSDESGAVFLKIFNSDPSEILYCDLKSKSVSQVLAVKQKDDKANALWSFEIVTPKSKE